MESDNLDRLTRDTPEGIQINEQSGRKFTEMKTAIKNICKTLSVSTGEYDPQDTMVYVNVFALPENKIFRVLYSEINSWLMSLALEDRGIFYSNTDALLQHVVKNETNPDITKIMFKIYDHVQLVNTQVLSVDNAVQSAKADFHREIKTIEREYITILGIFAAVVVAFVGAFTFSTSVMNNVGKAPFLELIVISCVIGVVFHSIVSLLIRFLYDINDKEIPRRKSNYILVLYLVIFFVGAVVGINFWADLKSMILKLLL